MEREQRPAPESRAQGARGVDTRCAVAEQESAIGVVADQDRTVSTLASSCLPSRVRALVYLRVFSRDGNDLGLSD